MNAFVTGATGLLGSHVAMSLLQKGYTVKALKRPNASTQVTANVFDSYIDSPKFDKIEWVDGDVTDYYSIEEALDGVDYVFHCAAMVSYWKKEFAQMHNVNVNGTANIVNACLHKGVKKLGFVSSVAALGHDDNVELYDETTKWKTSKYVTHYAKSKYAAEREVWRGVEEGLQAVIVNPAVIIGPGDWNRSSSQLIAGVDEGLKYYTTFYNGFVDVRDVVSLLISLVESPISGQRYIACAENLTWQDVFNRIADKLKRPRPTINTKEWMGRPVTLLHETIASITGKRPLLTYESTIQTFADYKFSSAKANNELGFYFARVEDAINNACGVYLEQKGR